MAKMQYTTAKILLTYLNIKMYKFCLKIKGQSIPVKILCLKSLFICAIIFFKTYEIALKLFYILRIACLIFMKKKKKLMPVPHKIQ